jgi:hypothetical protein
MPHCFWEDDFIIEPVEEVELPDPGQVDKGGSVANDGHSRPSSFKVATSSSYSAIS